MMSSKRSFLPAVLSLNGGYVDTAGFLALHGLFTAHVTGNFVTIGAALVFGTGDATAKLLALPMFCAVVVVTRLIAKRLERRGVNVLRTMLSVKVALLVAGAALAIAHGPFRGADGPSLISTGMLFVAAMAIQNAAHRIHFMSAPPTTLMTGTTTQIMIDLADWLRGDCPPATRARMAAMSLNVAAFAIGCAAAALLFHVISEWCFAVAPVLGAITPFLRPPAPPTPPPPPTAILDTHTK